MIKVKIGVKYRIELTQDQFNRLINHDKKLTPLYAELGKLGAYDIEYGYAYGVNLFFTLTTENDDSQEVWKNIEKAIYLAVRF